MKEKCKSLSDSGQKFMIRQIEEGDTKRGIPKDKFKEFVEFQKKWVEVKLRRWGVHPKGVYTK